MPTAGVYRGLAFGDQSCGFRAEVFNFHGAEVGLQQESKVSSMGP